MMMIPGPFPSSPQGPYFMQPQYRPAGYIATPQQYPGPAGTPGFYPSSSPAEYNNFAPAGAYYPAQQFPPSVQPTPVLINPGAQQQQPPPQPPQHIPTKRERRQIRIRDPNQGGRDITEEIMSGGRSGSTPTPPQTALSGSEGTANGESVPAASAPPLVRPDDRGKPSTPPRSKTLEPCKPCPVSSEISESNTIPSVSDAEDTPLSTNTSLSVLDIMDPLPPTPRDPSPPLQSAPEIPAYPAPLPDPIPSTVAQEQNTSESEEEEEEQIEELEKTVPSSNGVVETAISPVTMPQNHLEAPLESPIAQPEELRLPNGLPLPAPQDPEAPASSTAERDDSPIAEPEDVQQYENVPEPVNIVPIAQTIPPEHKDSEFVLEPIVEPEIPEVKAKIQETLPPVASKVTEEKTDSPEVQAEVKQEKEETKAPVEAAPEPESAPEIVPPAPTAEEKVDTPPPPTTMPAPVETTMQAAVSVPKKKRKMKELNKKEAVGDLLDAFKEEQVVVKPEPEPVLAPEPQAPTAPPTPEEAELTWEDKEDKLDAENIQPEPLKASITDKKYQYKEDNWKPINPEEKKKYDREFLLGFQFISASMNKPVGLPAISDVVLDKANKTPLRQLDPSRLPGMNCGPDFTPPFANLGRPGMGGGRGPPPGMGMGVGGPRRSQQMQRKEPRKIITSMSLNDDIQLNKAEKAWKPSVKKPTRRGEEMEQDDPEHQKTQELFKRVRSILNKLTPQKFQQLMKQVTELTIDTEERLKGVIDLTFEKAISEPDFSVAYANMCRCLMGLKVQATDQPGVTVNFRKLLLNRCQKEFEKDKDDD
ncbi:hypothetical protein NQD34_009856 [Periophthalmus magnuspinnatus]|nr:hypothetical protein NQD34_009856 [Periophthalmus magnuspinnatus]